MDRAKKIICAGLILAATWIVYQQFYRPQETEAIAPSGHRVEIAMRVKKGEWTWDPKEIHVKAGDHVLLKIKNEDDFDHGFALDVFGINKQLVPEQETLVEFDAVKTGTFKFYCSIPCGEGHYLQSGTFVVETTDGTVVDSGLGASISDFFSF